MEEHRVRGFGVIAGRSRPWVQVSAVTLALGLGACSGEIQDLGPEAMDERLNVDVDESGAEVVQSALTDSDSLTGTRARIVARGIRGAGAITQVGTFHRGGPLHDNPVMSVSTQPGQILEAKRLLVASTSNFGAPLAIAEEPAGSLLSLDVGYQGAGYSSAPAVAVPGDFASSGTQASAVDGLVRLYTAQSAAFLNRVNNPNAVTADLPGASLPLGISLNRGFGRPWLANAPRGAAGDGTITVLDPSGAPLAGAPSPVAGGVFAGALTNRAGAAHGLTAGALATALLTKSPDGSGRAVFLAALADGSIVQVHVSKGVDAFAPPGTFTPLPEVNTAQVESNRRRTVARVGLAFNWVPTRITYVTDPLADRIVALDMSDDGTLFHAAAPRYLTSPRFNVPVDIAPAVPEVAHDLFASNTTLGGGSDLYVLNRGNNTVVRVSQSGRFLASRQVITSSGRANYRVSGLAVSEDAQTLWITAVDQDGDGVVMQMPGFGAGPITPMLIERARANGATNLVAIGRDIFTNNLSPRHGLGPLYNDRSCAGCHNSTAVGGMGLEPDDAVVRFGSLVSGMFDPLPALGGPIARRHSISELGLSCNLVPGVPQAADVTSSRSAMTTAGTALIDAVLDSEILAAMNAQPEAVRGRPNRLADGRIGRFGWKAQVNSLVEFMGVAFRDEMGVTNPLFPTDLVKGCGAQWTTPEVDGVPLQAVSAFLGTIDPPVPAATCLASPGAATFQATGCASCHTPSFAGPGRRVNLYSDLLLHDMGPGLDDLTPQGSASGREWRTMPLWRVSERGQFLHDGRAKTILEAISAHGGQAEASAAAFQALSDADKQAVLDFLGCI